MYKILVSDPLEATGLAMLRESGHQVDELSAEEKPRLTEILPEYDALVVRSGTKVTAEVLAAGKNLRVVGRAGIGVDNVDTAAATQHGILVVNAPTANLLSATEHTFALMLALARNVPVADASLKNGEWNRKKYVGFELQGKTIGIIGFGRIGQQVARRAQAFDMSVLAYDPFIDHDVVRRLDAEPLSLEELLPRADMVTLHVPLTDDTRNLLNAERIGLLKPSALLVNCARGGVVDEDALLEALNNDRLAGAALDVFAKEPPEDYTLAQHPKVVATPHLGAQTREAQVRISTDTAEMVVKALEGSLAITAVNLPFRPAGTAGEPFLNLAERLGQLASSQVEGGLKRVRIELWGIEPQLETPISIAALRGMLAPFHDSVNYVNAEIVARDRGIQIVRSTYSEPADYPCLIKVRLESEQNSAEMAGTLVHKNDARVVNFDAHQLEFRPAGHLLIVRNNDVPGVVGRLGTELGNAGINIADIHLSREPGKNEALAVLRLDQDLDADVVSRLRQLDQVKSVYQVDLPTRA